MEEVRNALSGNAAASSLAASTAHERSRDVLPTFHPGVSDVAMAGPIHVRPGATVGGADVRVLLESPRRLNGRVVDAEGRPSAGHQLVVQRTNVIGGGRTLVARLANDGNFTVEGVPPGDYSVIASRSGPNAQYGAVRVVVGPADVDALEIALRRAAVVGGRVTGVAAAGTDSVLVDFLPEDGFAEASPRSVRCKASGEFLIDDLAAGTYRMRVRSGKAGFERVVGVVEITHNGSILGRVMSFTSGALVENLSIQVIGDR
jgi:hypothetical protein